MTIRIIPLLLVLLCTLFAGLSRTVCAQEVSIESIDKALAAKPSGADATKLADQIRMAAGRQDPGKGLRPRVQFVGQDAIVLFAIESANGTPHIEFTTDGSVFNTRTVPALTKLGDTALYAATVHLNGVADPKFPTGVGMDYVYTVDNKRVGGEHFENYPQNPDNQEDPKTPRQLKVNV